MNDRFWGIKADKVTTSEVGTAWSWNLINNDLLVVTYNNDRNLYCVNFNGRPIYDPDYDLSYDTYEKAKEKVDFVFRLEYERLKDHLTWRRRDDYDDDYGDEDAQ